MDRKSDIENLIIQKRQGIGNENKEGYYGDYVLRDGVQFIIVNKNL